MKHKFNSDILREYDIRGEVEKTLFEKDAKVIGHLIANKLSKNKKVNVCYDGRHSSINLKNSLIEGLKSFGANVVEIGLGPTPLLYYSCYLNNAEAGIMVTGSHNPPSHNGFKIVFNNQPFFGRQIQQLNKESINYVSKNKIGTLKSLDAQKNYTENLLNSLNQKKKLNIAWDAGNGAAGRVMKKLAQQVSGEQIIMFDDIDGDFPNHHPDPSEEKNLFHLIQKVKSKKLDFGVAFDGDGDRLGIVDNLGRVIPGDILLLLFAKNLLSKRKEITIVGDIKCSQVIFDEIEKLGGRAIISKTGHSLIKNCMIEKKAILGGEMSGHMFFADEYNGFDDGLYAAARFVNLVSYSKKKLSDLINEIPKVHNTPEIRIKCEDSKKFMIVDSMIEIQKKKGKKFLDIDGIRVKQDDGWFLLRASNTQPSIVIRCESSTKKGLDGIISYVKKDLELINKKLSDQIKS